MLQFFVGVVKTYISLLNFYYLSSEKRKLGINVFMFKPAV